VFEARGRKPLEPLRRARRVEIENLHEPRIASYVTSDFIGSILGSQ